MRVDKNLKRCSSLLTLAVACGLGVLASPPSVGAQQSCSADCTRRLADFFCFKSCSVSAQSVFCEDGSCTQATYGLCLGITWTSTGGSTSTQRLDCGILSPNPFEEEAAAAVEDDGAGGPRAPSMCSEGVFHPMYTTPDRSEWALVVIGPEQEGVAAEERMDLLAKSAGMSEERDPDWRTTLAEKIDYSVLSPELRAKLTGPETSLLVYPQQDSKLVYVDLQLSQFAGVKLPAEAEGQALVNVMTAPDGKILTVEVPWASDASVGQALRDAFEGLGQLPLRARSQEASPEGVPAEALAKAVGVVNAMSLVTVYEGSVATLVSSGSFVEGTSRRRTALR